MAYCAAGCNQEPVQAKMEQVVSLYSSRYNSCMCVEHYTTHAVRTCQAGDVFDVFTRVGVTYDVFDSAVARVCVRYCGVLHVCVFCRAISTLPESKSYGAYKVLWIFSPGMLNSKLEPYITCDWKSCTPSSSEGLAVGTRSVSQEK